MEVEVIDQTYSRLKPLEDLELVIPCLSYPHEHWRRGVYGKTKNKYEASMIHRGGGKFLSGLLPRIQKHCHENGISLTIPYLPEELLPEQLPRLPGITFREDQISILESIIDNQRGVIKSATGTGKTILAGGICSIWPSRHISFLCHTLDLLSQAERVFRQQFKFNNVWVLGGGENYFDWPEEPTILISTIQTYKNLDLRKHCDWADIIILDECHHLSDKNGMFAKVLEDTLAPIRIGLTATPPSHKIKERKELLTLEGYLGPIIGDFSYQEGMEAGILARPLINLLAVPYSPTIGELQRFKDIYQKGIMENRARNRMILTEAHKSILAGESVLILTSADTDHGHILKEMAMDLFDLDIPFVYGKTDKQSRQELQDMLESKEIKAVISNVVWKEGINIPSMRQGD